MSDQKPREFWIGDGEPTLVDAEDAPFLSRFKWHKGKNRKTFYVYTNVKVGNKKTKVSMHRLICGLTASHIDHKNRNGLDNRKENLRFATNSQNSCNRVRKNSYGYRGVFKPTGSSRFAFQIQYNGKRVTQYGFETARDAAAAYDIKNRELHGQYGIRNFED